MTTQRSPHRLLRNAAALFCAVSLISAVQAATVGHWRFESGAFLVDSGSNGFTLTTPATNGSPDPYALPATGAGSAFPGSIGGAPNTGAAIGIGTTASFFQREFRTFISSATANFANELSVEAFVNLANSSSSSSSVIAGQGVAAADDASWGLVVTSGNSGLGARTLVFQFNRDGGAWGTSLLTVNSNFVLELNTDYYIGMTADFSDSSTAGLTFYVQNLTAGTELEVINVAHNSSFTSMSVSDNPLTIGGSDFSNLPWYGVIDEVRLSDVKLGQGDLLISQIPEPSAFAAIAGVLTLGLACGRRRRR